MKKHLRFSLAVLSLCSASLVSAAGVALVLDVSGSARAQVAGRSTALDIASSLEPGTRIDLDKGSEVSFVFYPTRQQFTAVGPAALRISKEAVTQLQGAAMKSKNLPDNRATAALGFQERVVPAALVMRSIVVKPKPLEPLDGETVLTDRPEFVWTAGAGESLDFSLTLDGAAVHLQQIEGNRLVLPVGLVLVSGREYRWQIAFSNGDKNATKWGSFTVAGANLRQQVQGEQPAAQADLADWVLYAMTLDQNQMKSEANRVWKRVAEKRPTSDKLKNLTR